MSVGAVVRARETSRDDAGVPLCTGCQMQEGEYHQKDCTVAYPPTMKEQVRALDLPPGRACRCGSRMSLKSVDEVGVWKVVQWDCRCGRTFGAQVNPETNEIAHTEWER